MLSCTIAGISQEMNLEQNETLTYLVLRLDDGTQVRAAIDEEAAALVIARHLQTAGVPKPAVALRSTAATRSVHAPVQLEPIGTDYEEAREPVADHEQDDTPLVFGGDVSADMADTEALPLVEEQGLQEEQEETPPLPPVKARERVRPNTQRTRAGKLVVPTKTVPKDSNGYPVGAGAGVDPGTLTGERNRDEDDVGSV